MNSVPFFSIVIACYNMEEYLDEAVNHLLDQQLPFREYVELILVDDGSSDRTGELADAWHAKYPENITVVHQKNAGVSAARNAGLARAHGRYINFMDADDYFMADVLQKVYRFIHETEQKGESVDVFTIPLYFFEAQKGPHVLNYRFDRGTRIIDLDEEIDAVHMFVTASFVRSEAIGEARFDTRLQISEDANFLLPILMQKRKLGVVSNAKYMYRRRKGENKSAIQGSSTKKSWYMVTPQVLYQEMPEKMQKTYGCVPRYIQYTLMYDMQWRFRMKHLPPDVLSEEEKQQYWNTLLSTLRLIDPDIILMQKNLSPMLMQYLLELRIAEEPLEQRQDYRAQFRQRCGSFTADIGMEFLSSAENHLEIECYYLRPVTDSDSSMALSLTLDGAKQYAPVSVPRNTVDYCVDHPCARKEGYVFRIPLSDFSGASGRLSFALTDGGEPMRVQLSYRTFFPLNNAFQQMYACVGPIILKPAEQGFHWERNTSLAAVRQELRLYREFLRLGFRTGIRPVLMRLMAHAVKRLHRKPILLVSDRPENADDNGEAMFRHIREHHREMHAGFVIARESKDYQRLGKIGRVVPYRSYLHKLLVLCCDCQLISSGTRDSENPFTGGYAPYTDMMAAQKYVFLQHGVTRYDLSGWGNRYVKNFSAFITSSDRETASIVEGEYYYRADQVWNTGMARFDRLYHDERRIVTIMPTWRKYLADRPEDFGQSRYLKAWMDVLTDKRLHDALKQYGYTLQLVMHPNMRAFSEYFEPLPNVRLVAEDTAFRDMLAQSDLLITDFSSIVFDFAYLKKPVLLYHFDYEEFFSGSHTQMPGYFDDKRDGFGDVCMDHDSLVNAIIRTLAGGCRQEEKYAQRVEQFYTHMDQNNCERIYQCVMQLIGQPVPVKEVTSDA